MVSARLRIPRNLTLLVLACGLLLLTGAVTAGARSPDARASSGAVTTAAPYVPGVVIVGYTGTASDKDRTDARKAVGGAQAQPLSPLTPRAERWRLPAGTSVAEAIATLSRDPDVRYVEPDYIVTRVAISNDPSFTSGALWGMYGDASSPANQWGSQAAEAWGAGYTGSDQVYVGVIDEGIDVSHPDLAANIWTNPFDAVDGTDNDGNGRIDDVNGWDFVSNDRTVYDAGQDSHGTHVSGTIGGVGGNGIGVAGVNWDVTLISGKFLGPNGGSTSGAIAAVDYFTDLKTRHGLNIVATSNSWGGGGYSQALRDAINRGGSAGILFIAAAGNSTSNNDAGAYYPSNYQCTTVSNDCVIAVASTTSTGAISSFSSYGATTVDIGAPGSSVTSTLPGNTYGSYSGTSMATPHVSGAVALCTSINPTLTAAQTKSAIMGSSAATASLAGKTVTGGRLDVGAMVSLCNPPSTPPAGTPSSLAATAPGFDRVSLTWVDGVTNETRYDVERATAESGACGPFSVIASASINATMYTDTGLAGTTTYCYRVRGANALGETGYSNVVQVTTPASPAAFACVATTLGWVDPAGGTPLALGDDSAATVTLPFAVAAYQSTVTTASISSNGFIRLGGGAATAYSNVPIPDVGDPNGIIAAAWDDWNPGAGGTVSHRTIGTSPNRQYVVTWSSVPVYGGGTDTASFQVVLDEAGGFTLQYLDMVVGSTAQNNGASATAGIESATGQLGTQVSHNQTRLASGSAYRCTDRAEAAPTITTTSLPNAVAGIAYAGAVQATGGTQPYTWTLASGATLPAGLTLGTDGNISGTPTVPGSWSFGVVVAGADGRTATRTLSIVVAAVPVISGLPLPDGATGTPYNATLTATGGTGLSWSVASGALPAGLALSAGGVISGTPTAAGAATFAVRVRNAEGGETTANASISVQAIFAISTSSLPNGTGGATYGPVQLSATGATGTVTWTATGLPAGLSLSETGALSGVPTASGTFTAAVMATDKAGTAQAVEKTRSYTLDIAFGRLAPGNGSRVPGRTSTTLSWSAHQGAAGYRYCITTSNKGCTVTSLSPAASLSVTLSGLTANKTYYWRVSAVSASGALIAANAGALWRFTTAR